MPEETKNAAVSGEWKLVPVTQLKKWHRDMDACQKVMWLRGGFDPAYCMDAQDCLKEMDSVLAAPAPPAGGVQFIGYPPVPEDRKLVSAGEKADMTVGDKRNPFHNPAIADGYASGWNSRNREVTRLLAENAALQHRLNAADQQVDDLQKDKERLDSLEANYWDVRHHSSALGDTGDYTSCVEIVGHWMDKPHERVIGENYNENLRAAIDQAMTADAYPPERPEYPELDAALSDEDWHMNPCKLGHRDVGACGGKAFCHTCDETITAATTQEAFELWNATHPSTPQ